MSEDPIVLVCGADEQYAMPLCVMLYSAIDNLEAEAAINIYIIDGGVNERSRARLDHVLDVEHITTRLEWIQPDLGTLSGLKEIKHLKKASYLRLLIPHVVPERFEKAIYLDCDLVVESNIGHLWKKEIGEYALLAVQDNWMPYLPSKFLRPEFGLTGRIPNFNTGVMVLNLKRFREENLSSEVFRICREHQVHDQDGLNIVVAGDWGHLNPRWNQLYYLYWFDSWPSSEFKDKIQGIYQSLLNEPYIIHYTGRDKPWLAGCGHPLRHRFNHYLKKSKWFSKGGWMLWHNMMVLRDFSRPIRHKLGLHRESLMYQLWTK